MGRHIAVLVGLALLAGTISNLVAGPTRVLSWVGSYQALPPKSVTTPPATPVAPTDGAATPAPPAAGTAPHSHEGEPLQPFEIDNKSAIDEHGKGTLFVDARATDVFEKGHIPGARSIPVWESSADQKVMELMMQNPPPATRVVIYCQGGHCEDSHMLRQKLLGAGYADVLVYKDGFPGWESAGQAVEK